MGSERCLVMMPTVDVQTSNPASPVSDTDRRRLGRLGTASPSLIPLLRNPALTADQSRISGIPQWSYGCLACHLPRNSILPNPSFRGSPPTRASECLISTTNGQDIRLESRIRQRSGLTKLFCIPFHITNAMAKIFKDCEL